MKPTRLRNWCRAAWLAAAVLSLNGCIDFERQTLTLRYDEEADRLLIHQRFIGIFGDDDPAGLSASEVAELESVMTGERTFFFANWIFELDLAELRQPADPETPPEQAALARLTAANTRISNGPFYLDEAGRLCGVQRVVINNASEILRGAWSRFRAAAQAAADDADQPEADRALARRFADERAGLVIGGGRGLAIRIPFTAAEYAQQKAGMEPDNRQELEDLEAAFTAAGGRIGHDDGMMTWSLGNCGAEPAAISMEVAEKPCRPNAIPFVIRRFGIASAFDPAADEAEFFAQHPDKAGSR